MLRAHHISCSMLSQIGRQETYNLRKRLAAPIHVRRSRRRDDQALLITSARLPLKLSNYEPCLACCFFRDGIAHMYRSQVKSSLQDTCGGHRIHVRQVQLLSHVLPYHSLCYAKTGWPWRWRGASPRLVPYSNARAGDRVKVQMNASRGPLTLLLCVFCGEHSSFPPPGLSIVPAICAVSRRNLRLFPVASPERTAGYIPDR